jgi:hypothetical protein
MKTLRDIWERKEKRQKALEQNLPSIVEQLKALGALKVILFGSLLPPDPLSEQSSWGMILKERGKEVHGLTTAAGIWAVGGIGLAIGAGLYLLGVTSAVLVGLLLALERLLRIDERLAMRREKERDG